MRLLPPGMVPVVWAPCSLNEPVLHRHGGERTGLELWELIPDPACDTERDVESEEQAKVLGEAMAQLPLPYQRVLEARFGMLEDGVEHTLAEIGEVLGVSRERVRQIEAKALKQMKVGLVARGVRPRNVL